MLLRREVKAASYLLEVLSGRKSCYLLRISELIYGNYI